MAPRIDRKNLGRKTVRSSMTFKNEIKVEGEPDPKVTWSIEGKPVKNERLNIDSDDHLTTFLLRKAKRADSGIYKIVAKNDSGTDEAEMELVVIGESSTLFSSYIVDWYLDLFIHFMLNWLWHWFFLISINQN